MSTPAPHVQTDKAGRRYTVWVCTAGHWHRGRAQAVRCEKKSRG